MAGETVQLSKLDQMVGTKLWFKERIRLCQGNGKCFEKLLSKGLRFRKKKLVKEPILCYSGSMSFF